MHCTMQNNKWGVYNKIRTCIIFTFFVNMHKLIIKIYTKKTIVCTQHIFFPN